MARDHSDVLSGRSFSTSQPEAREAIDRGMGFVVVKTASLICRFYMQVAVLFHTNYDHVMLRGHEVSGGLCDTCRQRTLV